LHVKNPDRTCQKSPISSGFFHKFCLFVKQKQTQQPLFPQKTDFQSVKIGKTTHFRTKFAQGNKKVYLCTFSSNLLKYNRLKALTPRYSVKISSFFACNKILFSRNCGKFITKMKKITPILYIEDAHHTLNCVKKCADFKKKKNGNCAMYREISLHLSKQQT